MGFGEFFRGWKSRTSRRIAPVCDEVAAAIHNVLGLTLHDVQLRGGRALLGRNIVEMETGEGKTVTAVLPLAVHAREGGGVLLATANDYLARRDAESLRPVFDRLGLSVGHIEAGQSADERRRAYRCDITYGTVREFGFDFLRDQISEQQFVERGQSVGGAGLQRPPHVILLDEADSLLIDEARTPLLISLAGTPLSPAAAACYRWCAAAAPRFTIGTHYVRRGTSGVTALTETGRSLVFSLVMPAAMASLTLTDIFHSLERALYVNHAFHRDRHYVVKEGRVLIVDEYTGRINPGRNWSAGIHQAIEAREGAPFTPESGRAAQITVQEFVRRFPIIAGMTGTAREARRELWSVYGLGVVRLPTHRPVLRQRLRDEIRLTAEQKWEAVVQETATLRDAGRAVLIGTRTVDASAALAARLAAAGIEHVVLNALNPQREAEIVSAAGQPHRVTVATNMAGRGTDIPLSNAVRQAGGLHVIGTELHAASRIDRQLAGRCGRQGDPGTFRQYLSLDDEILTTAFGEAMHQALRKEASRSDDLQRFEARLRQAQRIVEQRQWTDRKLLSRHRAEIADHYHRLGIDPVTASVPDSSTA